MRYPNAAQGLKLMFLGQILMIVSSFFFLIPILGLVLLAAAEVLELLGIYTAGKDDENYRGALVFAAALLAAGLISGLLQPGFLSSLLGLASSVLNFLVVFSVCNTTSNLLHSVGQEALSQRGALVVKIFAACTAVSLLCQLLSIIPIVNIAAALVSGIAGLVMVVGYVMYLLFLNNSSQALG